MSVFGSDDLHRFADDGERQELITQFIVRDQVNTLNGGMSLGHRADAVARLSVAAGFLGRPFCGRSGAGGLARRRISSSC